MAITAVAEGESEIVNDGAHRVSPQKVFPRKRVDPQAADAVPPSNNKIRAKIWN